MIYLTKTDPARNMAHFYVLDIQPTLFPLGAASSGAREAQGSRLVFWCQPVAVVARNRDQ